MILDYFTNYDFLNLLDYVNILFEKDLRKELEKMEVKFISVAIYKKANISTLKIEQHSTSQSCSFAMFAIAGLGTNPKKNGVDSDCDLNPLNICIIYIQSLNQESSSIFYFVYSNPNQESVIFQKWIRI